MFENLQVSPEHLQNIRTSCGDMSECLSRIRIVLVNTSHPGNIGSAARAMKTMGIHDLHLVTPQQFPHPKAKELASGANDLLEEATITSSLADAIADCQLVIGTSARMRTIPWPLFSPREMAIQIQQESGNHRVAILFGREQTGLTNEELACCHWHVQIPSDPHYGSLNIAAAVQIICYEVRIALLKPDVLKTKPTDCLSNANDLENFFLHLQETLVDIGFLKMNAPRKLMTRLRRLFLRARPRVMEVNLLRGLLTAIQRSLQRK